MATDRGTIDPVFVDLVCWDFGDTVCDQTFMQIAPPGVDEWPEIYRDVVAARPEWVNKLDLGETTLNDLIAPLSERTGMGRAAVARHLRQVWRQITWWDEPMSWVRRLDGVVLQAMVTVNPHEFWAMAALGHLDQLVDVIVTSAEVHSLSKVVMADRARALLGLEAGLGTTLLIDNLAANTEEFAAAGGHTITFTDGFGSEAERLLAPLLP